MWIEKLSNNPITLATERKKQIDFEVEKEKEGLFNLISQELNNLNTDDLIYIFENILSHSLEDGKIFMLRLWIPRDIWIHCINTPRFFVKHPDFVNKFRHLISLDKNLKTDFVAEYYLNTTKDFPLQDKKYYLIGDKKSNPHISFFKNFHSENDGFQHSEKADLIVEKMNNIYGKYIKLLDNWQSWKVERHTIDDRSEWRKYWEDTLFPMISRIWKYYPKNFIEIIYDSLPDSNRDIEYPEKQKYVYSILDGYHKNKLEDWFITAEDVQEIVQILVSKNLIDENDVDYIYKKLKYYRPLDTVLYAKVRSAEDENLKELKQLLEKYYWKNRESDLVVEKNWNTWSYEIKKAKEDLQEREEKEISKKYQNLWRRWTINWDIYCEAMNRTKKGIASSLLKNWKEILQEYDDAEVCGVVNWKIYITAEKKDGKKVLLEDEKEILQEYDNIDNFKIFDWKFYCNWEKNWKRVLLENGKEVSNEYDSIQFCETLDRNDSNEETLPHRYIWKKDGKVVLLKNGKEISDTYDDIVYYGVINWKIYYRAKRNWKRLMLENGKEITGEYSDIVISAIEWWIMYCVAMNHNKWILLKNNNETITDYAFISSYKPASWNEYFFAQKRNRTRVLCKNWEEITDSYEDFVHYERLDGKIYCVLRDNNYNEDLFENGEKILEWFSSIEYCESANWDIYCVAKKDGIYHLFKNREDILDDCTRLKFCEIVDWNIYHLATRNGKKVLLKNGIPMTGEYDDFEYGKWLNWKLYSTAKQDWKWMLLENWDEISKKYDKIEFQGTLDWKIYHVAKENDKWKVLEDGKEILSWYDDIRLCDKVNWKIYCEAQKWKYRVLLEDWKEISKEYERIHFYGIRNWNIYFVGEKDRKQSLYENKIISSDELKLPTQIKDKLDFLNLCMSCGRLTTENLLEVQAKINEYMITQYNKEKQNEYSYNWLLSSCAKKLSYLFSNMIKRQPSELIKTINPTADKWNEDKQAESFFDILFKNELPDKVVHEKKQAMWWPSKSWFDDTWKSSTKSNLQEALKEEWLSNMSLESKATSSDISDKYGIVWDISMETYNHINSLLTVHQYSWFDFDSATQEEINEYLTQESSRLQWEFQESSVEWESNAWKMLVDKVEDFVSKSRFDDKWQWCEELEKTIDTIKDSLRDEEYQKLNSLLEYFKTDQN